MVLFNKDEIIILLHLIFQLIPFFVFVAVVSNTICARLDSGFWQKKEVNQCLLIDFLLVGVPGFEPGTPCSQSRCANRTALHPEMCYFFPKNVPLSNLAERGGFEPPVQLPVRQFSKLLVSATHPSLLKFGWCKCRNHFHVVKIIWWKIEYFFLRSEGMNYEPQIER